MKVYTRGSEWEVVQWVDNGKDKSIECLKVKFVLGARKENGVRT